MFECVDYTYQRVKLFAQNPEKRLKLLLIARDVDLNGLANSTGLSMSLIEKIASGHRVPTARTIARLENFFSARIFSSPKKHRARRNTAEPPRRYTFRAGCRIEFSDSEAAACLVAECAGRVTQDGNTVTFTSDVQGTFTFPREYESAPTAVSQQNSHVGPSPTPSV